MSSLINTSDLSVYHLHSVDNDDSDRDGGDGGHATLSLLFLGLGHRW